MNDFAVVLALALFPALGNFFGGLLAEFVPTSKRALNRALHAVAGVVIAIVAVELTPRALQATSGWLVAIAPSASAASLTSPSERWSTGCRGTPPTRAIAAVCGWSISPSPWTCSAMG
jgi:hypothetical protein